MDEDVGETIGRPMLVVEDNDDLRFQVATFFKNEGYRVFTANGGEKAFEVWNSERMDLIVTDIRMPDGSGESLLANLNNTGEELPIVLVMTAHGDMTLLEAFDQGASAVFIKPFNPLDLLGAARHFLRLFDRSRRYEHELKRLQALVTSLSPDPDPLHESSPIIDPGFLLMRGIDDQTIALTPTELKVLTLFTQAPNQTLSRVGVVSRLWGESAYGKRAFSVQLSRLRKKLQNSDFDIINTGGETYQLKHTKTSHISFL